jgi:hypothetical protein
MGMGNFLRAQGRSRLLIGIVAFFNLECALAFLLNPAGYAPSFELSGVVGTSVIRGFGVLFLMWNVPYVFAIWDPIHNRVSVIQAAVMQAIGVFGESFILAGLPAGHINLRAAIGRFIIFDGVGLIAILAAIWITRSSRNVIVQEV